MTDLLKLAERCEQASGPDLDLSHDIARALVGHSGYKYQPYTASLDAAMTLVPEGWQGDRLSWWAGCEASCVLIETHLVGDEWVREAGWLGRVEGEAATPALALCAAALRARAAS
jgi:hypothetical protein